MSISTVQKLVSCARKKKLKYWIFPLLVGILIFSLLHFATVSHAQNIRPQRATFDPSNSIEILPNAFQGTIRVYPNGRTPTVRPNEHRVLRSSGTVRDQVWVAGDSQSWAHFQFWQDIEYQGQRSDPLVQAGSDQTPTFYIFPCEVNVGTSIIAWGLTAEGSSECEYITANHSSWHTNTSNSISYKSNLQEITQDSDLNLNQITISRSTELALIKIYNIDDKVAVDVLVGAVQVSALNSLPNSVDAGNRYLQTPDGGRVEPINLDEVVDSSSIRTFLTETNWSPDITPLLNELKLALPVAPQAQLTELQQEILDVHNRLRSDVNVPPLLWSEELENYAQEWANYLSQENIFEHSPGVGLSGSGENIAAGSSMTQMLNLWIEERDDYEGSSNTCRIDNGCLHYTQMVWRNTTQIGCGVAPHERYGNVMVCNYSPPGNYIGQRPY